MDNLTDDAKFKCPDICPVNAPKPEEKVYAQAGGTRNENPHAGQYVPGFIRPYKPKKYPPGAPPLYLPQPTDSTSGDILGMGPIGPWAAGHLDWTPHAGTTGVRPVVDKYSITRYSTGEWRKNNAYILTPRATDRAKAVEIKNRKEMHDAFELLKNKEDDSNNKLKKRVQDLEYWKKQVEIAMQGINDEIEFLDYDRARLKGASRILNIPEAISRECLELRTFRYEPDLVRDDAEQELIKEVAIVGEIRRVFNNTLAKVEEQMAMNRAAKANIEMDWSDKLASLNNDKLNLAMTQNSSVLQFHPGVARWPENATTLDYWEHFCKESIRNCNEVVQKSKDLRGDLSSIIVKGSQDMKIQADRTNAALAESVSASEKMCEHLEANLKDNLQTIANIEIFLDHLNELMREADQRTKLNMTRLYARNYDRPNVENCRDEAQYALMAEAKLLKETLESIKGKTREALGIRSELMKYRGDLEKEIACKRKSLNLDKDRLKRVRDHMPSPEEFAG